MRSIVLRATALAVSTALLSILVATGCAKKRTQIKPAAQYYNEGICFMSKRKGGDFFNPPDYEKARESFQEIIYEHPTSRFAPLAELRIADTFYEAGDYLTAAEYYEQWRKRRVGRPETPYSIYRTGMSYYHLMLSLDRDQTYTRKARINFRFLLSGYPKNEYARAIGKKMKVLNVRLARHEMYVGKFYFRHRHWWASIDRFYTVLSEYMKNGFDEEALFYAWRAYRKLGRFEESAKVYHQMVKRFPKGEWTKRAKPYQLIETA